MSSWQASVGCMQRGAQSCHSIEGCYVYIYNKTSWYLIWMYSVPSIFSISQRWIGLHLRSGNTRRIRSSQGKKAHPLPPFFPTETHSSRTVQIQVILTTQKLPAQDMVLGLRRIDDRSPKCHFRCHGRMVDALHRTFRKNQTQRIGEKHDMPSPMFFQKTISLETLFCTYSIDIHRASQWNYSAP